MSGVSFLCLVVLSGVLTAGSLWPIYNIIAALAHEFGHIIVMRLVCKGRYTFRFVGFGFRITPRELLSYKNEIFVALGGPIVNIVCGALFFAIYFLNEAPFAGGMCISNFFYAVLNLLPIAPLDGHKALTTLLQMNLEYENISKINKRISGVMLGIFLLCILLLVFNQLYNPSLLIILLLLIGNTILSFYR